jgi:predicted GNAT superfamily acetyltransferase
MDESDLYRYRELTSHEDHERCVALQRVTWGDDFRELVPPAFLLVAQKLGGVLLGAFDPGGDLVGFVFGLTGLRDGEPTHWSHMLAVRNDLRDHGIGRHLKELQPTRVAALGIRRIQWTFAPLVARNAHLNLNGLGVRVLQYVEGMYGESPVSIMDSVIGSDRLIVEWPTGEVGAPKAPAAPPSVAPVVSSGGIGALPDLVDAPVVLVEVPPDIQALKREAPKTAAAWRESTRRAFTHYLALGYEVAGFPRGFYLLQRPEGLGA